MPVFSSSGLKLVIFVCGLQYLQLSNIYLPSNLNIVLWICNSSQQEPHTHTHTRLTLGLCSRRQSICLLVSNKRGQSALTRSNRLFTPPSSFNLQSSNLRHCSNSRATREMNTTCRMNFAHDCVCMSPVLVQQTNRVWNVQGTKAPFCLQVLRAEVNQGQEVTGWFCGYLKPTSKRSDRLLFYVA